jgi:hypothetical protein
MGLYGLLQGQLYLFFKVKLGLNSIKGNNVLNNKIKPLHTSANDDHDQKATNTSKEGFEEILETIGTT